MFIFDYPCGLEFIYIKEYVDYCDYFLFAAVTRLKGDNTLYGSSLIEYVSLFSS